MAKVGETLVGTEPVVGSPFGRLVGSPGVWIVGDAVATGKVAGSPVEGPGGRLRDGELGMPGGRELGSAVGVWKTVGTSVGNSTGRLEERMVGNPVAGPGGRL